MKYLNVILSIVILTTILMCSSVNAEEPYTVPTPVGGQPSDSLNYCKEFCDSGQPNPSQKLMFGYDTYVCGRYVNYILGNVGMVPIAPFLLEHSKFSYELILARTSNGYYQPYLIIKDIDDSVRDDKKYLENFFYTQNTSTLQTNKIYNNPSYASSLENGYAITLSVPFLCSAFCGGVIDGILDIPEGVPLGDVLRDYAKGNNTTGYKFQSTLDKTYDPEKGEWVKDYKYDLEIPLGLDGKNGDVNDSTSSTGVFAYQMGGLDKFFDGGIDSEKFLLKWTQSPGVLSSPEFPQWETEIMTSFFGKYWFTLTPWDKKRFESEFLLTDTIISKNLQYEWNVSDSNTKKVFQDWFGKLTNTEFGEGHSHYFNTPNLMIRNAYYDEATQTQHYSNYVLIELNKDGKWTATEIDSKPIDNSDNVMNTDDVLANKNFDSVYDGTDNNLTVADDTNKTFNNILGDMFSLVKDFPSYVGKLFTFLPAWATGLFGLLLASVVIIRILGRQFL